MRLAKLALPLTLLAPAGLAQSTWYVDVNGVPPGTGTALAPYTSIDFALAQPATVSGDLVLVLPGTYAENVRFPGKGVTVLSTGGEGVTVIDAGGLGSAVSFLGTDGTSMRLQGFTVRGGGGTPVSGSTRGGGVYGLDAICELVRCTVELNDAASGGGLHFEDCVAKVRRTLVRDNTTTDTGPAGWPAGGGMAVIGGSVDVARSSFLDNLSGTQYSNPGRGGAVHVSGGGLVTLAACRIRGNRAESAGGGVWGAASLDRCSVENNSAQFGGGVCGPADVVDTYFAGNLANTLDEANNWGAAAQGGTVLTDCTLQANTAFGSGGGVDGATLFGCRLAGNTAVAGDAAFWASGGADSSFLADCEVSGNHASGNSIEPALGGGAGMSTLVDCDVFGNGTSSVAAYPPDGGGGVWSSNLTGCRVFDNASQGRGGGAHESTLLSTEVFDNTAHAGGGVADSQLDRCTVYGNSAPIAGGMMSISGASAVNTILWGNGVEVDGPGPVAITWSDVQGGYAGTGNIALDPLFWNEAARDFHLMAGSPCIDAGNPASPPDPDGSVADMGAHPFDPTYTGP